MLNQFHGVARKQFRADFTMMTYDGVIDSVTLLSMRALPAGGRPPGDERGDCRSAALVAFNSLVALANQPIMILMHIWDNLQLANVLPQPAGRHLPAGAGAGRTTAPGSCRSSRSRAGSAFRHVGFRYGGPESPPILEDITFEVPPGHHGGHRRPERLGQDHPDQVPGGAPRADRGHHSLRRDRAQDAQLPRPPPEDRLRAAGEPPLRRHRSPATSPSATRSPTWTG